MTSTRHFGQNLNGSSRAYWRVWDIKASFPMRVVQRRKSVSSTSSHGFVMSRQTAVSVAGGSETPSGSDSRSNWGRIGDSMEAETRTWTVNVSKATAWDRDRVLELYRGYPGGDFIHTNVDEHNSYGGSLAIGFDPSGGKNYIPVKFIGPLRISMTSANTWSFSVDLEEVR